MTRGISDRIVKNIDLSIRRIDKDKVLYDENTEYKWRASCFDKG